MKKTKKKASIDPQLFQIGEAAKAMKVTRRMILNYEECGLLTPALREPKTGYRYYSADNLRQIHLIRILQGYGMSLNEIREYLNDTLQLADTIKRLEKLRNQLDTSIAKLHVRMNTTDMPQFYWTTLPRQTSYCKKMYSTTLAERTCELRDTYIEAVRKHGVDQSMHMFTEHMLNDGKNCKMFIPIEEGCTGEHICIIPECRAICTYHRGPYENIPISLKRLLEYAQQKELKPCGTVRVIYMEGPTNRGNDKENYITQISVPIEDKFKDIPRG